MSAKLNTADKENYGPLWRLIGTWEGQKGDDTAPGNDRGIEKSKFRELVAYTAMGAADNHEQKLFVVSYSRTAWRLGEPDPFHQQLGYWLWDARAKQVMHSFMIPRGMTVLAGGSCESKGLHLKVEAKLNSSTFGICSNPFLDREFQTVAYVGELKFEGDDTYQYEEDTQIKIKGQEKIFHHVDKNVLKRKS